MLTTSDYARTADDVVSKAKEDRFSGTQSTPTLTKSRGARLS
jgi:hypothetical protein